MWLDILFFVLGNLGFIHCLASFQIKEKKNHSRWTLEQSPTQSQYFGLKWLLLSCSVYEIISGVFRLKMKVRAQSARNWGERVIVWPGILVVWVAVEDFLELIGLWVEFLTQGHMFLQWRESSQIWGLIAGDMVTGMKEITSRWSALAAGRLALHVPLYLQWPEQCRAGCGCSVLNG